MKRRLGWLAVGLGVLGFGASAQAQEGGLISDQNMIFILGFQPDAPNWGPLIIRPSYTALDGQITDFSQTNQVVWFYRLPTDTRENLFNSSGGGTQEINGNQITVHQLYDGFTADQAWTVTSTGDLTGILKSQLTVTNTSGSDMEMTVIFYGDIDAEGTFTNDKAHWLEGGAIRVRDEDGLRAIFSAPGAEAYQVTPYRTLMNSLTDEGLTNLDNSGLPLHGDFTGAWQWTLQIPAGESQSVFARIAWKR